MIFWSFHSICKLFWGWTHGVRIVFSEFISWTSTLPPINLVHWQWPQCLWTHRLVWHHDSTQPANFVWQKSIWSYNIYCILSKVWSPNPKSVLQSKPLTREVNLSACLFPHVLDGFSAAAMRLLWLPQLLWQALLDELRYAKEPVQRTVQQVRNCILFKWESHHCFSVVCRQDLMVSYVHRFHLHGFGALISEIAQTQHATQHPAFPLTGETSRHPLGQGWDLENLPFGLRTCRWSIHLFQ